MCFNEDTKFTFLLSAVLSFIYSYDFSKQMPFPKKLPFSEFVPKVYSQLKEFIYACLKYSEDLHLR